MKLAEMKEKLNGLSDELGTLAATEERTSEQDERLTQVLAEFNDFAPKVEEALKAHNAAARAKELHQQANRASGVVAGDEREQGGAETMARTMGIGERFATSDAVKDWLKRGGPESSDKVAIESLFGASPVTYTGADGRPIDRHALVKTGDPVYLVPPQVPRQIYRPLDDARTVRSFLINGRTTSDTIYFLRELTFTNAAAPTAQASSFDVTALGSSGRKPESTLTFEQASEAVKTIAHWIPITRQAIADAPQLQTYIEGRLLVGLEDVLNEQVLVGDGTGENFTGIAETTGINTLDAAYWATPGNETQNVGTDLEPFDRILRARTVIRQTGKARPSFVVLHPADIEVLLTVADSTERYLGVGPFGGGLLNTLWGLPVAEDPAMTEGEAIVGDGTMAAIWDREDANILIDTINDQFVRNMLTILAELRAAFTVFRPAAFALVDLYA